MKNMKLRDMPSFVCATNPNDFMLNYLNRESWHNTKATAIVLNTFDELEHTVLDPTNHASSNLHGGPTVSTLLKGKQGTRQLNFMERRYEMLEMARWEKNQAQLFT
jgi:hypothetical protein